MIIMTNKPKDDQGQGQTDLVGWLYQSLTPL